MKLLDLFCGAGGAAMGYHRAGWTVVGVDVKSQPHYPFEFHQGDALEFPLDGFDAIHASPPCQAHSTIGKQIRGRHAHIEHVDLVAPTRERLVASGRPYVIENVPGTPLLNPIQLCGSSFGLDLRRHRLFESNMALMALPCAHYWQTPRFVLPDKRRHIKGVASTVGVYGHTNYAGEHGMRQRAMGIDWMTPYELTQAIPPAYTELIGGQLMDVVRRREAA